MTKVYLVIGEKCRPNGTVNIRAQRNIFAVFTNKKLALKCVEYMNRRWLQAIQENSDCEKQFIEYYHVNERKIEKYDFSRMPY